MSDRRIIVGYRLYGYSLETKSMEIIRAFASLDRLKQFMHEYQEDNPNRKIYFRIETKIY